MRISQMTQFHDLFQIAPNSIRQEQQAQRSAGTEDGIKIFHELWTGEVVQISPEAYEEMRKKMGTVFDRIDDVQPQTGNMFIDKTLAADLNARRKLYESGTFSHTLDSGTTISMEKQSEESYLATIRQTNGQERVVEINGNTRITEREDGSIDVVRAGSGATIKGSSGDDFIVSFDASVDGGDGNDFIYQAKHKGNSYREMHLKGGAGNDTIISLWNGDEGIIDGGDGNDTLISNWHGTLLGGSGDNYIGGGVAVAGDGNNIIVDCTSVTAGNGDNIIAQSCGILVGDGNNKIDTNNGVTIEAGNGDNEINAHGAKIQVGNGNNKIKLEYGSIWAGDGDNEITSRSANIVAGNGNNSINADSGSLFEEYIFLGNGDNNVTANSLDVRAGDGDNIIALSYGRVNTGDGNDVVTIAYGQVNTGDGEDKIFAANSEIDSGRDNDFIYATDGTVNSGHGDDIILASHCEIDSGGGDDKIFAVHSKIDSSGGDDVIFAAHSDINAGHGDDYINAVDSKINGGAGNDIIKSQAYLLDSLIVPSAGNDTVTVTGGTGSRLNKSV